MIYTDRVHIVADSLEELHSWAENSGIKRHFFEGVKKGHPHYDCPKKMAVKLNMMIKDGYAELVTSKELLILSKKMIKKE